MLLKYLNNKEADNSPDFQKMEKEMDCLRELIGKLRPNIMKMMRQYVSKQYERCCVPKSKKIDPPSAKGH